MTEKTKKKKPKNKPSDYGKLKEYLRRTLNYELEANPPEVDQYHETLAKWLEQAYASTKIDLPKKQQDELFREVLDDLAGYGPIQSLLDDPEVSEVMVNGADLVFIEKKGKLIETDVRFEDEDHVRRVIDRMLHPLGLRVDSDHPNADARLPDGSRVNIVIPPVAHKGSCITIRKFLINKLSIEEIIKLGSLTANMAEFLRACVAARFNIIISGNTSSGKTTFLNILTDFFPEDERIVTIEDAAELQLRQRHVVSLETRPPGVDGAGGVTTRDLVKNVLRMRPDRIVVGEVRSGESLDMLQAMNTGHDGSLTTLHANSPRDAIARLETMALMAGFDIPLHAIRTQIAAAIDLIVHQARLQDGSRKTTRITEVSGMEGNVVTLSDIFKFEQKGVAEDGTIEGELIPTGIRPIFTPKLEVAGFKLAM
ncbi:MAG: CpaF family protein [Chloroflexi bacterium]|nr:CpaF family protein [Chloroflexota bacterium]